MRLLSVIARKEAFNIGSLAYLRGLTSKLPDLSPLDLPFGGDSEWMEAYFKGILWAVRNVYRAQRCKGCSGCNVNPEFMEIEDLLKQYGGFDEETLLLMQRTLDNRHNPHRAQYTLHVTDDHLSPTPRNQAPDKANRPVSYIVMNGVKRRKNPTQAESWAEHRLAHPIQRSLPPLTLAEIRKQRLARSDASA